MRRRRHLTIAAIGIGLGCTAVDRYVATGGHLAAFAFGLFAGQLCQVWSHRYFAKGMADGKI